MKKKEIEILEEKIGYNLVIIYSIGIAVGLTSGLVMLFLSPYLNRVAYLVVSLCVGIACVSFGYFLLKKTTVPLLERYKSLLKRGGVCESSD